jgi:hypothetical protein
MEADVGRKRRKRRLASLDVRTKARILKGTGSDSEKLAETRRSRMRRMREGRNGDRVIKKLNLLPEDGTAREKE